MADAPARLRVATLNVWALPFGISRHTRERMRAISEELAEIEVDVVCFQEVWIPEARDALVAGGARAGLDRAWFHEAGVGGSGLLILSRLPLQTPEFETYRARGLPHRLDHGDYHSGKGFGRVTVTTDAGPVGLLDTHLHAQYSPDPDDTYRGIRVAQLVQLAAALAEDEQPQVALGDFNIREHNPEYPILVGLSGLRDVAVTLDRRQDTSLADSPYHQRGHRGHDRIDYIFVRDGSQRRVRPVSVRRVFARPIEIAAEPARHSDHAGLRAEIEIEPALAARPPRPEPIAIGRAREWLAWGCEEAERRRSLGRGVAALGIGSGVALPLVRRRVSDRRRALRLLLAGATALAWPIGLGSGALSEWHTPREIESLREAEALLDRLLARSGRPA